MEAGNPTTTPSRRASHWAILLCALPALALTLAIMSQEASVIAKINGTKDLSTLFEVTLKTGSINAREAFRPALERAGIHNLSSNSSVSDRFSTSLKKYYLLQGDRYSPCWGYDYCGTQESFGHSVYVDFPRQFLFNLTHSIVDNTTNHTVRLEVPEDVVPVMPQEYLNEMFHAITKTHKKAFVLGVVVSTIGVAAVLFNIGLSLRMGASSGISLTTCCVASLLQLLKIIPMSCILQDDYNDWSNSKANELLQEWGMRLDRFKAEYLPDKDMWLFRYIPIGLGAIFLSFTMFILPEKIVEFERKCRLKWEDKRLEKERTCHLV